MSLTVTMAKPKGLFQYRKIKRLYHTAFPLSERKPFSVIRKMEKMGKTEIWYFSDEKGFVGMATTIQSESIVLIDYLAVNEKRRGQGIGSRMLRLLFARYQGYGLFLEIECLDERAENSMERIRRKAFYLKAGFVPMETYVKLFGVDMELLGVGCHLNFEEYRTFYLENYSRFAYDHITPACAPEEKK